MGRVQIVRKNERKAHLFCALNVGDLFLNTDEEVCIKIPPVFTAGDDILTAICIEDGAQCYYDDSDPVIPIRATMTIEEE